MEVNVDLCSPENARKKQRQPENWKVTKQKLQRYSPKAMPNYPTCGHRGECLNCSLLTMVDIKEFHAAFYTVRTKMSQDAFILKYCSVSTPVRYRPRSGDRVVSGTSCGKNALDKNKFSIYTWTENEMCKSSNEVASAVFHELDSHSFMPSDRVFGGIEREINKKEKIVKVEEYHESFSGHGTVKKLGEHWENFDWKTQTKEYIKDTKDFHFKISRIRRLVLTKHRKPKCIKVQGEMTYLHDTAQALKVNKPGKNLSTINPVQFKIGVKVQSAKLKDVQKLLQNHYGNQWH
ncbi:hypothetical protein J6590_062729 [Homalodisca vitripennis]|nr:hypothetical protein J6590_062729 [Homalodisca vitripennis]